jgi:gas vesicle protein
MRRTETKEKENSKVASQEFDMLIQKIFIDKVENISENKKNEIKTSIDELKKNIKNYLGDNIVEINSKLKKLENSIEKLTTDQSEELIEELKTAHSDQSEKLIKELTTAYSEQSENIIEIIKTEISNLKQENNNSLTELKQDSENNKLVLVNKNNEITESLLTRLDSIEIEMRKTKKINFILTSSIICILILLSGFQIYFRF